MFILLLLLQQYGVKTLNGNRNALKQELRSVERGYLSYCFKSRTRDLGHAPFGVIHRPLCSTCHGLSNKEQELSYRKQIARQLHKH